MRRWVKWTLAGIVLVAVIFTIIAGTTAYYVFRDLDTRTASETEAQGDFQTIRTRFGTRPPLIEIGAQKTDIKINRSVEASAGPVTTLHVVTWEAAENEVFKTAVPIWLMRFSSINLLSQMGLAPEQFKLTVQDIERYGPGVVVDYNQPGRSRVLVWVN